MSRVRRMLPALLLVLAAVVLPASVWASPLITGTSAGVMSYPPIAPGPKTVLPDFIGAAATARPLPDAGVPQDPHLGPIPYSYLHDDSWNSDTSSGPGPHGRDLETVSTSLGLPAVLQWAASMNTMAFDSHGRLVVAFMQDGLVSGMDVLLVDPVSLDVLCRYPAGTSSITGAYFYVDDQDRVVIGTGAHTIATLREGGTNAAPTLEPVPRMQYDLSQVVPSDDRLAGLLVDWSGRIWFETSGAGANAGPRVGVIDPAAWPRVRWTQLGTGEQIANGMAVTKNGTFVLTSQALYKLVAGRDDRPRVVWRAGYDSSDTEKPGQMCVGSGTSPTVLGGGDYVAINDSATPMKVVVFRTADTLMRGQQRLVGAMPVFEDMAGQASADSLIGYRDSIVVENNYGHSDAYDANGFLTSTPNLPGLERIDIKPGGTGLRKVWVNDQVASVAVPKLSTQTGLIYVVDRQQDAVKDVDVYYWTALDLRTGNVVWRKMAGRGVAWDSYWGAPSLGPSGTLYIGNYGGLAAVRDGD
jgi:hypothetical protein